MSARNMINVADERCTGQENNNYAREYKRNPTEDDWNTSVSPKCQTMPRDRDRRSRSADEGGISR